MNLADDIAEDNSSDSDDDANKNNKTKMNDKVYDEIAMASFDISMSTARMDSAAIIVPKNDSAPALPEDNEIVEETNEEEEE